MALSFLCLFGLKPFHIKAMVIHIDNGAVGEVDAIVLVIDTGDEKAILVMFVTEGFVGGAAENVVQL